MSALHPPRSARRLLDRAVDSRPVQGGAAMSEQRRIAGSNEAKVEPALALAAIATHMNFNQFAAMVAAAASRPKGGALARAMAGSPRAGADAIAKGRCR